MYKLYYNSCKHIPNVKHRNVNWDLNSTFSYSRATCGLSRTHFMTFFAPYFLFLLLFQISPPMVVASFSNYQSSYLIINNTFSKHLPILSLKIWMKSRQTFCFFQYLPMPLSLSLSMIITFSQFYNLYTKLRTTFCLIVN